jgi:hypothetical protein
VSDVIEERKEKAMSTQLLQMPGDVIVHRSGRRIAVAASIAVALFAGTLVGRSTAPATSTVVVRPATALSTIGESSAGDATRSAMFGAMNGLQPTMTVQPVTRLHPNDVSTSSRAEMFGAMNRLRQGRY